MSDSKERAELIREEQRKEWTVSAASWERPPKFGTAADDPVTDALLTLAGIGAGQRVLDLRAATVTPHWPSPDGWAQPGKCWAWTFRTEW